MSTTPQTPRPRPPFPAQPGQRTAGAAPAQGASQPAARPPAQRPAAPPAQQAAKPPAQRPAPPVQQAAARPPATRPAPPAQRPAPPPRQEAAAAPVAPTRVARTANPSQATAGKKPQVRPTQQQVEVTDEDLANAVGGMEGAPADPPEDPTQPLDQGDMEGYQEAGEGYDDGEYLQEEAPAGDPTDNDVWDEGDGQTDEYAAEEAQAEPEPEPEPAPPVKPKAAPRQPAQKPAAPPAPAPTRPAPPEPQAHKPSHQNGQSGQAAEKVLAGLVKQVDDLTQEVVKLISPDLNAAMVKFLNALAVAIEKYNK